MKRRIIKSLVMGFFVLTLFSGFGKTLAESKTCEDWLWECEQACMINPNCDSSYCVREYIKCLGS